MAFWNAEGVTLRRRGVHTREFRVDRYGAPRYPELVLATTRRTLDERRDLVRNTLDALRDGTREALAHPPTAVSEVAKASGEQEPVVAAQFDALKAGVPAAARLNRTALRAWARFDVRFGILQRPPDLERAFASPKGAAPRRAPPPRAPCASAAPRGPRPPPRPAGARPPPRGSRRRASAARRYAPRQPLLGVGGQVHHLHVGRVVRRHDLVAGRARAPRAASSRTAGRDTAALRAPRRAATAPGGGRTPGAPTRAGPTSG